MINVLKINCGLLSEVGIYQHFSTFTPKKRLKQMTTMNMHAGADVILCCNLVTNLDLDYSD